MHPGGRVLGCCCVALVLLVVVLVVLQLALRLVLRLVVRLPEWPVGMSAV